MAARRTRTEAADPVGPAEAVASPRGPARARPRQPLQQRSRERVAAILAAAEALLREGGAPAVTAHAVAERASLPPASVYQFFPSREALLVALARRFIDEVWPVFDDHMARARIERWPDIIYTITDVAKEFYTRFPFVAPLVLGSYRTTEIYNTDKGFNDQIAHTLAATFDRFFVMPPIPDFERKLLIVLEIADAVWGISLRDHGGFTDALNEEARRAMISYLANFLPPELPRRD